MGASTMELKSVDVAKGKRKSKKKRAASELDTTSAVNKDATGLVEPIDELNIKDDLTEPTMGEKLASLNLLDDTDKSPEKESSLVAKPPSADSVHILLKQALHADDREQLLNCLFTQDEKVIGNSTSLLNPSDVLKLLHSLISILQSRGAVVSCALPWLRSLLLQHASIIISQESSLLALNSLYQLIDARVSTSRSTLQLSNCLNYHFPKITVDTDEMTAPVIFEDKDSDEDESEDDAMENDEESEQEEEPEAAVNGFSDFEDSEDEMSS